MPTDEGYNGAFTGPQIDEGIARANRAIPKVLTLTLLASGWSANSQTVTATGVLADETKQMIYIVPAAAYQSDYIGSGISCTAQGSNTLTFTCQKVPSKDLTVYTTIQSLT